MMYLPARYGSIESSSCPLGPLALVVAFPTRFATLARLFALILGKRALTTSCYLKPSMILSEQ
jgi:hypothetical protein